MEMKRCETIEELETLLSRERIWPTVIIKTVKGNLRHRIEKLGEEVEEAALTDKQRVLRKVASAQHSINYCLRTLPGLFGEEVHSSIANRLMQF